LVTLKFIVGRQTCHPSRAKKGLKDWANKSFGEAAQPTVLSPEVNFVGVLADDLQLDVLGFGLKKIGIGSIGKFHQSFGQVA
jgi:hypothetical protein